MQVLSFVILKIDTVRLREVPLLLFLLLAVCSYQVKRFVNLECNFLLFNIIFFL